jgi:molecular chaperone DnaJ
MPKNFYIVLGINRDADLQKIKSAYRKIIKTCHPDKSKSKEDREKFLLAQKAYETLRDTQKRQQYDDQLNDKNSANGGRTSRVTDIVEKRRSRYDHMNQFISAADEFFSGFVPGIFERSGGYEKDLYLDLILSPNEAQRGGIFPIAIPVVRSCRFCSGDGLKGPFICPHCLGVGKISEQAELGLNLPAHVQHGTEVTLPLADAGLSHVCLKITVLIESFP